MDGKERMEKYIFYQEIGSGGSGKVFKAYDRHLQCLVAVKRFEAGDRISGRELEMLKELRHPAFPAVMDYLEENGRCYLVMEYIEGQNLADYIDEKGAVRQEQAVRWALELAEALIYLHEGKRPVVYRDMKPANIIIDGREHIWLVDFGTAFWRYQETQEAYAGGTWGYAAPEQFEANSARAVDERSDIYGLGATLFHMLTGCNPSRPPFLMQPVRFYDRRLSAGLEKVVKRATQEEKEKRYQTVRRMKRALESYRRADQARRYVEWAGKTVYGLALAGGGFYFLWLWAWIEEEAAGLHRLEAAESLASAWQGKQDVLLGVLHGMFSGLTEILHGMSGGFAEVLHRMSGVFTEVSRGMSGGFAEILRRVSGGFTEIWQGKPDGLTSIWQKLASGLANLGQGIMDRIEGLGSLAIGEQATAEKRILAVAFCIVFLCIVKGLINRWRSRGYRGIRQEKNVLLSIKKGKGLAMGLFLGILTAGMDGGGSAWAREAPETETNGKEENDLFVVVRGGQGQKLLIRYDTEYALSDTLSLDLPLKNFAQGGHYELRLECTNRETGEAQSRVFYLKRAEP